MSDSDEDKRSDSAIDNKEDNNIPPSKRESLEELNEQKISAAESSTESDSETKSDKIGTPKSIIETNLIDESKTLSSIVDKAFVLEEHLDSVNDNLPLSEIHKQKLFQKLIKEAEERSKLLKPRLISQLSEAFKMFDINHDGFIDETDLKFTFSSLGETNVSDEKIKKMINESTKPIDFNTFVALFESKEMEFDSEIELIKAFSKWDTKSNGFLFEESLKNDLQSWGDRFSENEADCALEEAPVYEEDGKSTIDYIEFCANLCGLQNVRQFEVFQQKYLNNSNK